MEGASTEMPRYKCHKQVWALEISGLFEVSHDLEMCRLAFKDDGYADIEVGSEMFHRYRPSPGDFYVVYPSVDGAESYASISPRKAFLDGYTRI